MVYCILVFFPLPQEGKAYTRKAGGAVVSPGLLSMGWVETGGTGGIAVGIGAAGGATAAATGSGAGAAAAEGAAAGVALAGAAERQGGIMLISASYMLQQLKVSISGIPIPASSPLQCPA